MNSHSRASAWSAIAFAFAALLASASLQAGGDNYPTFGPYYALVMNREIVTDVKVTESGRIYLLLNPGVKEKEIILKNSSGNKSGYRNWFNGKLELVSPANQGKAPNEYTDWVETTGNYIEYYMDGALFLHLGKSVVVDAQ